LNTDVENLKESGQPDDGFDLPEEPVAIFCGDPNGPIYVYADGRAVQLTGRDTQTVIRASLREGGEGSGDRNHPGNPGHVGDKSSDGGSS
jgi:hypothetical protein